MKTKLDFDPTDINPDPSTVDGARSLVERFYALNPRLAAAHGRPPSGTPCPSNQTKILISDGKTRFTVR